MQAHGMRGGTCRRTVSCQWERVSGRELKRSILHDCNTHDGCLVNGSDVGASVLLGVLKRVAGDALGSLVGDELDRLDDAIDDLSHAFQPTVAPRPSLALTHLVLDTRVLSLSVLTNDDRVDAIVGRLVPDNGSARSDVSVKVESAAESQVERDVTFADWGSDGTVGRTSASRRRNPIDCYALGVARGPLSAIVFFLIDLIAFSGIVETPSMMTGVTSTSSHWMGTC